MSDYKKSLFLLHFVVLLFGFTGILGKLISMSSYHLVFYRMLIASVALLIFVLATKRWNFTWPMFKKLALIGVLTALHWVCFFEAIKLTNVSIALACLSSASFFTAILEPIILKQKLIKSDLMLGIAVIAGVSIMFGASAGNTLGISIAILAAALAAIFTVLNAKVAKDHPPSLISFFAMASGFLFLLPLLILKEGGLPPLPKGLDWFWILVLGIICTAFAFVAAVRVMKHLSPFTVALSVNLEPIYAIVLAFIIFGEHQELGFNFFFGASIIFLSVFTKGVISHRKKKLKLAQKP